MFKKLSCLLLLVVMFPLTVNAARHSSHYHHYRVKATSFLAGSREILVHQNVMAREAGLVAVQNQTEIDVMVERGELVPLPTSNALLVDPHLPANRRFCRTWTALFLINLSTAYYNQWHTPLMVTSAIRSIEFQKKLRKRNSNAAGLEGDAASPHLTGIAVDITKRHMSKKQLNWMRDILGNYLLTQTVDIEEEFHQSVFHISVYREYAVPVGKNLPNFQLNDAAMVAFN